MHIPLISRRLGESDADGCAGDHDDHRENAEADCGADDECSDPKQRNDTGEGGNSDSGHLSAIALGEAPCEGNKSDQTAEAGSSARQERRAGEFQKASANRTSDLSAKRNLGLLLARLHGWNKIAFVDDDVTLSQTANIARLAGQLDEHQVAGMVVRRFPDNSVVCHARRLAGLQQDVFLTGAVLGVHCNSLPLSFFPDIYNEDWFFFAAEAASRRLPRVGNATQAEYDPFASHGRARREEFGDLLAEGLYALIGQEDPTVPFDELLRGATKTYWDRFIEARHEAITQSKTALERFIDRDSSVSVPSSALNWGRCGYHRL